MRIRFGNGGWVRVDDENLPGPLYLRYKLAGNRPVLVEMYLDAGGTEIHPGITRDLDLRAYTAQVFMATTQYYPEWLARSVQIPGPDLSRLASYFGSSFGRRANHWVADSFRAQYEDSDVPQAPRAGERGTPTTPKAPVPVRPPENGLSDDFLSLVADNYAWAVGTGQSPAPMIAAQAQCSVRTVHAWVRKARDRGIMPPTSQGRRG